MSRERGYRESIEKTRSGSSRIERPVAILIRRWFIEQRVKLYLNSRRQRKSLSLSLCKVDLSSRPVSILLFSYEENKYCLCVVREMYHASKRAVVSFISYARELFMPVFFIVVHQSVSPFPHSHGHFECTVCPAVSILVQTCRFLSDPPRVCVIIYGETSLVQVLHRIGISAVLCILASCSRISPRGSREGRKNSLEISWWFRN